MTDDVDTDELTERNICEHCIGEDHLWAEIQRDGVQDDCSYCDAYAKAITIEELAGRVATVMGQRFTVRR